MVDSRGRKATVNRIHNGYRTEIVS